MAEYIEREAAVAAISGMHPKPNLIIVRERLANIPAADVVEVRHGYWYLVEYEFLNCSECGNMYYTGMESTAQAKQNLMDGEVPNYCPNCGAKMDGKGGDQ